MQYYPCEAQPADMLTRAFLTFQMPAMSSLLFQSTVQCILIPTVQNQKNKKQPKQTAVLPPPCLCPLDLPDFKGLVLTCLLELLFTVKFLTFQFF